VRVASLGTTHSTAVKGRSSTRMRMGLQPPPSCSSVWQARVRQQWHRLRHA
jgi:hypothetical protein